MGSVLAVCVGATMTDPKLATITTDGSFRSKIEATLDHMRGHGEDPKIFETLRTVEQQRKKVRDGVSKTMRSYHLKKGSDGHAKAADIASKSKGWNCSQRFWLLLGANAQYRGLGWGGLFDFNAAQRARVLAAFETLRAAGWPKSHPLYKERGLVSWDPAHVQFDSNW